MHFAAGTIIIRSDATYPSGALVVVGPAAEGGLRAHPEGGGTEIVLPQADLPRFAVVSQDEAVPIFRRTRFEVEGCDARFDGWSDGAAWNGWARPWFDFPTAQTVLAALAPGWRYDEPAKSWRRTDGDDDLE